MSIWIIFTFIFLVVMILSIVDSFFKKKSEKAGLLELATQIEQYKVEGKELHEKQNEQFKRLAEAFRMQRRETADFLEKTQVLLEDVEEISSNIVEANHKMMNRLQVLEKVLQENDITLANSDIAWLMNSFSQEIAENTALLERKHIEFNNRYRHFEKRKIQEIKVDSMDFSENQSQEQASQIPREPPQKQQPKEHDCNDHDWRDLER